jgi:hypothetical protein
LEFGRGARLKWSDLIGRKILGHFFAVEGIPGLFDEQDPQLHAGIRRKVAGAYAMTSLVQSEPFVDECTSIFCSRLTEFAETGALIDVTHWLQCYAFDVIGKITVC